MTTVVHHPKRRQLLLGLALATTLTGCAEFKTLRSDVSSYGQWPAERNGASYAFDRLPSQQSQADKTAELEALAAPALAAAGLKPVAAGATPDLLVQLGARVERTDRSPWDDPFWPRPWVVVGRPSMLWYMPGWGFTSPPRPDYQREVAVLIRDRASGQALYETRAVSSGSLSGTDAVLRAMFAAALKEFPLAQAKPHEVAVLMP